MNIEILAQDIRELSSNLVITRQMMKDLVTAHKVDVVVGNHFLNMNPSGRRFVRAFLEEWESYLIEEIKRCSNNLTDIKYVHRQPISDRLAELLIQKVEEKELNEPSQQAPDDDDMVF